MHVSVHHLRHLIARQRIVGFSNGISRLLRIRTAAAHFRARRSILLQFFQALVEAHVTKVVESWILEVFLLAGEGALQKRLGLAKLFGVKLLGSVIEMFPGSRRRGHCDIRG